MNSTSILQKLSPEITYIILDTNFLLVPIQFKIDIFEQIKNLITNTVKFIILQDIMSELTNIHKVEKRPKLKLEISGSIAFLNKKMNENPADFLNLELPNSNNLKIDDYLIEISNSIMVNNIDIYLASNDKELRRKCRNNKIKNIFVRQRKILIIQ